MSALAAAFADPVLEAQAVFRAVMNAMARPGTIEPINTDLAPPPPLSPAAAAVALSLADYETLVWLDPPLAAAPDVARWLRFHAGARITTRPDEAIFALIADPLRVPAFDTFALGTMEYPDRSTTLVMQVERLAGETPFTLSGPGIAGAHLFGATPLPDDMHARLAANRALFPRGVDLLFVTGQALAALPRSTRIAGRG
jgi:alpha-D-ribose 1-methylphosphonate 5-triphosphate synthase subunit PhnH